MEHQRKMKTSVPTLSTHPAHIYDSVVTRYLIVPPFETPEHGHEIEYVTTAVSMDS